MNSAPLPQPSAFTCPNCGAVIESRPPFCPQCGASLSGTPSKSNGCLIIGAQIVLALVAIVLGLGGACFVLLGGAEMKQGGSGIFGVGLGAVVIAGLCIWGIIRLAKR
jgi:hypothetical protein